MIYVISVHILNIGSFSFTQDLTDNTDAESRPEILAELELNQHLAFEKLSKECDIILELRFDREEILPKRWSSNQINEKKVEIQMVSEQRQKKYRDIDSCTTNDGMRF